MTLGTTERVLRLLGLLQRRPVWTGAELAAELGVTGRCVRRDVGRLRELGYPVNAERGTGGGYRLGPGRRLPPLLLDHEETVAVAVSLRLAAGGSVAGASETALRALAKLDQVMPPRLREEVRALHTATATLTAGAARVDGELLLILARATRDLVRVRFRYTTREGLTGQRIVEPVHLVVTEHRWYLMAWDPEREDWRTFRLDRMEGAAATTWRFRPREHPEPAAYVQESVTAAPYRHVARVRLHADAADVRALLPPHVAAIEPDPRGRPGWCLFTSGADDPEILAFHLARMGFETDVLGPPQLREAAQRLAKRLHAL